MPALYGTVCPHHRQRSGRRARCRLGAGHESDRRKLRTRSNRSSSARSNWLSDKPTWLLTHRPMWSIGAGSSGEPVRMVYGDLRSGRILANDRPHSIWCLPGHVHMAQLVWFTPESQRAPQLIAGGGGTQLDTSRAECSTARDLGDPDLVQGWRWQDFGFMTIQPIDNGYVTGVRLLDGIGACHLSIGRAGAHLPSRLSPATIPANDRFASCRRGLAYGESQSRNHWHRLVGDTCPSAEPDQLRRRRGHRRRRPRRRASAHLRRRVRGNETPFPIIWSSWRSSRMRSWWSRRTTRTTVW